MKMLVGYDFNKSAFVYASTHPYCYLDAIIQTERQKAIVSASDEFKIIIKSLPHTFKDKDEKVCFINLMKIVAEMQMAMFDSSKIKEVILLDYAEVKFFTKLESYYLDFKTFLRNRPIINADELSQNISNYIFLNQSLPPIHNFEELDQDKFSSAILLIENVRKKKL